MFFQKINWMFVLLATIWPKSPFAENTEKSTHYTCYVVPRSHEVTGVFSKQIGNSMNSANSLNLIITEAWIIINLNILSVACVLLVPW